MTDRPATPAAARLTLAHQALANLLGVVCCSVLQDQRFADVMVMIDQVLPAARLAPPPGFAPVVEAAETLANLWPEIRKGRARDSDWAAARWEAQDALADFFLSRAVAAMTAHAAAQPQSPEAADAKS